MAAGFVLVESPYPGVILREFMVTNSEAVAINQALIISSGRVTKATAATALAAFSTQAVTAGTDQKCICKIPLPGEIYEVGYTGTPDGSFLVGCATCDLSTATAQLIAAADVTGGKFTLVSKDTTNTKCQVMVNSTIWW